MMLPFTFALCLLTAAATEQPTLLVQPPTEAAPPAEPPTLLLQPPTETTPLTHAGLALSIGPSIDTAGFGGVVRFWPVSWLSIDAHYAWAVFWDMFEFGLTYDHELHNTSFGRHALLLRGFGGAMRDLHALDGLFSGAPPRDPSVRCLTGGTAAGYGYRIGYFDARILAGVRVIGPGAAEETQVAPELMLNLSLYLPLK